MVIIIYLLNNGYVPPPGGYFLPSDPREILTVRKYNKIVWRALYRSLFCALIAAGQQPDPPSVGTQEDFIREEVKRTVQFSLVQ